MELSYDYGFDQVQYNGNIAGAKWRSKGDGEQRAFGYGYDNANRLLKADFTQNNGGWSQSAGLNFNVKMGDGVSYNTAYDENGNIRGMQQWGVKLNSSIQIDNLSYNYVSNSNKLLNVIDAANDTQTSLGDFRSSQMYMNNIGSKSSATIDYNYDVNGNLIQDLNKDIGTIVYNHLNLPYLITVNGKGTIKYIYDAAGNKLEKRTVETSPTSKTTVTTYIGGAVYENDVLQFMGHEEGRVRVVRGSGSPVYVYDYFIKDHLGNTRMVLTDEQKTDAYPVASLEAGTIATEKLYYNIPDGATMNKNTVAGYPSDTYTNPNDYIQKLNGNGTKVGTSITLKVMSGDSYNLRANSWYRNNGASPASPVSPISSILSALAGGISAASGGKATAATLLGNNTLDPAVGNFLSNQTTISTRPKAFLNWILFDEQFKYVSGGFDQVGNDQEFKTHTQTALPITRNGYLYVYVSNETPNIDVFFDNLQVTHTRGPLLSESHYYPYGLEIAALSSKSAGSLLNKRLFNGGNELQSKEFSDGSGLDVYDAVHRSYDQQLGIFRQIDPIADLSLRFSPYAFANNNPITFNDPLGLIADSTDKKGNVWHGLDDVSVKSTRKKKPRGFYLPSSTKSQRQEWDKNENTYWSRYLNHQSLSQKGDPASYTSRLGMYNRWSNEEQNYRAMQSWAVGIMATPVLISISPTAIFAALRMKLQANLVAAGADFGIQALMNGNQHQSILGNWNPVATGSAFLIGTPTHTLGNIAGVSLINATLANTINLSSEARNKGTIFRFDATSIIINAAFGTAGGAMGNQLKVDFRNISLGEGVSQTVNLTGAVIDDKK